MRISAVPGFRRRAPKMPADLQELLGLTGSDRVLAWSPLVGGGAVAARPDEVVVVTPRGERTARPWHEVDHAAWDQDSRTLAVWWVGSRQTTPLELLDDEGRLPEVIRERVQSSVVLTAQVPLPGGRTGRVALRRRKDGSLVTQRLLPPGVSESDPAVARALDAAEVELRSEAGGATSAPGAPPSL